MPADSNISLKSPPKGWDAFKLGDLCAISGGGTPSRNLPSYWSGEIPWASVKDFTDDQIILHDTQEHISESGLANSASNLVPPNTALICTRMAVGRCALTTRETAINQDVKALFPAIPIESKFFIRLLHFQSSILDRKSIGSTVRGISTADLRNLELLLPSLPEQTRIARILDTADALIAKSESVIGKLRQVRAGLLHDLLTRGLDADGRLRDPAAHPKQFKDSSLGRIPREWEEKTCEHLCREIVVGIVVKPAQYYVPNGVPVLRSANLRENGIHLNDLVFISPESNKMLSKSILRHNDLVTVRTGYPGTTCVVPEYLDGINCVDLVISRPGPEVISNFLVIWINSPFGKDQVLRVQGGLAQQHFNVGDMRKLIVCLPPMHEQEAIAALLATHDRMIAAEQTELAKLRQLKSGLMTDLLEGRVRVPEEASRHAAST